MVSITHGGDWLPVTTWHAIMHQMGLGSEITMVSAVWMSSMECWETHSINGGGPSFNSRVSENPVDLKKWWLDLWEVGKHAALIENNTVRIRIWLSWGECYNKETGSEDFNYKLFNTNLYADVLWIEISILLHLGTQTSKNGEELVYYNLYNEEA